MAKRLSEKQKEEIIRLFILGENIEKLSKKNDCTKLTISRNLKKILGEEKFAEYLSKVNPSSKSEEINRKEISFGDNNDLNEKNKKEKSPYEKNKNNNLEEELFPTTPFVEITPLNHEIENVPQKDLSSVPISDVKFPKLVYMIVDKKIELETKYLKDYPDWQFLSQEELERNTIEIYIDLKKAKRFCNKDQKVIKVPNTEVFKIVAPILVSRGISRIVSEDKLIAL